MTDYAKWNRFVDEDSEEEEQSSAPRVTKFDGTGGRTIQIGPKGAMLLDSSTPCATASPASPAATSSWDTTNGGLCEDFAWRQTRDEVVVQLFVRSASLKAKDVSVTYDAASRALVVSAEGRALLDGVLLHAIEPNPSADGEAPVDWELKRRNTGQPAAAVLLLREEEVKEEGKEAAVAAQRFLELTLRKKPPLPGVVVWWKSLCEGGAEIDVTAIAGRDSAALRDTRAAWDEAHAMFRSKVAAQERVEVDLSEAEAEAEDD